MMMRGDTGAPVLELQRALLELGYELPRWGADGDLGSETLDALAQFLREHGASVDDDADVVSDAELTLLRSVLQSTRDTGLGPTWPGGRFHDLRASASQDKLSGRRPWSQITGITLHQTACVFGEKPQRWRNVAAHFGVTRGGQVLWLHDFEQVVWHGNGLNSSTVGIEMEGTYAGVDGEPATFWRPQSEPDRQPQQPTPALVGAGARDRALDLRSGRSSPRQGDQAVRPPTGEQDAPVGPRLRAVAAGRHPAVQ